MTPDHEAEHSTWHQSRPIRIIAWGCLIVSLLCLAEVVLIAIKGGEWNYGIHAHNPWPRLMFAALCTLAWYCLRFGLAFTRRQWRQFIGRLVLTAFSVGIGLLAAEIGLRLYLQRTQSLQSIRHLKKGGHPKGLTIMSAHPLAAITQPSDNPNLLFELIPDFEMNFGGQWLRTNHDGNRQDRNYPVERAPRSVRIIGIGDSGMFGWSVEQNENYCAVLESNLSARADGVLYEVLNLAVPGYNTQLEVESLRYKGLRYKPDVVVVGWCENDFQFPFFVPQEGQWTRRDVSFLYLLLFDRQGYADNALSRVRDLRGYDEGRIPKRFRQGVLEDGVRRAFEELKGLAETNRFHVLVFGLMQPEAVALCQAAGLPYFNVKERIPYDQYPEDYAIFFMHPRAPGHRVLAHYLERELQDRGWLHDENPGIANSP